MKNLLTYWLIIATVILSGCNTQNDSTGIGIDTDNTNLSEESGEDPLQDTGSTPIINANAALSYDPETRIASITWAEGSQPDATGYLVQKQTLGYFARAASGPTSDTESWVTIKRLGVGGGQYVVQDTIDSPTTYRVIGETDGIVRAGNTESAMQIDTEFSATILTLQNNIEAPTPLNKTIDLSISSDFIDQVQRVEYFIDTIKVSSSTDKNSHFKIPLNTVNYLNGIHRVDAKVYTSANSSILVKKGIETFNTNLAATLSTVGSQGQVYIVVNASSKVSITNVKIYLNDQLVYDDNELNYKACSRYTFNCTDNNAYAYLWNTQDDKPDTYQLRTIVTDSAGEKVEKTLNFNLNNPPEISALLPKDASLISDNLTISGRVSDDEQPTPLVVVKLGDQTLYSDYTNQFSTAYSMSGLPEKEYVISVTATDASGLSTRKVMTVLYKSGSETQTALIRLPENTLVLDIKNNTILYRDIQSTGVSKTEAHYQNHYLMDLSTGSIAQIKTPDTDYIYQIGYKLRHDGILFYSALVANPDGPDYSHSYRYDSGVYTDLGSKIIDEHTQETAVYLTGNCTSTYCQSLSPFLDNKIMLSRFNNTYRPGYTLLDLHDFSTQIIPQANNGGLALFNSKYLVQYLSKYTSNYWYYHLLVTDYQNTTLFETSGTSSREFALGLDESRLVYIYWDKETAKNSLYYKELESSSAAVKIVEDYSGQPVFSNGTTAWIKDNNLYVLKANQTIPEQLISGASIVKFEGDLLIYQKDGKLYQWNANTNLTQEVWPQNEKLFIDDERIYLYRNNEIYTI